MPSSAPILRAACMIAGEQQDFLPLPFERVHERAPCGRNASRESERGQQVWRGEQHHGLAAARWRKSCVSFRP